MDFLYAVFCLILFGDLPGGVLATDGTFAPKSDGIEPGAFVIFCVDVIEYCAAALLPI